MSWPITFRGTAPSVERFNHVFWDWPTEWGPKLVGDLWYAPALLELPTEGAAALWRPSPRYFREHAGKRPPMILQLPGGYSFAVDGPFWRDGKPVGEGWAVSGDPPLITMAPSVNIVGTYHGYVQNGVIGDDVEGRKF